MPLITFEGADGVGKTTQLQMFAEVLERRGMDVITQREPGGTALGGQIRALLLDSDVTRSPNAELLLFSAARAQIMAEVIQPALDAETTVLLDRYVDSTVAYQCYGLGISRAQVAAANALSCAVVPDMTFLLVAPDDVRTGRLGALDGIEQRGGDFYRRVNDGYDTLAREEPDRIHVVDARGDVDDIHAQVLRAYDMRFTRHK